MSVFAGANRAHGREELVGAVGWVELVARAHAGKADPDRGVGPVDRDSYQELIEPAREHVTTMDSEIQTWRSDANFSNYQIWLTIVCACSVYT